MHCSKSWDEIKQNPMLAKNVKIALKTFYDCEVEDDEVEVLLYFQPEIFTIAVLRTAGIEYEE